MLGIGSAVAALVAAGLLIVMRRRRRRLAPPRSGEYDWSIVGRFGVRANFSCGHADHRNTDFVLRSSSGDLYYRRSVARPSADGLPCGTCLVRLLRASKPLEAVKEHHLTLLSHPPVA